ncbi:MAG: glycosyltransferase family 9 protein [Thermodesulfobacteriota bacterium]
MLDLQGPVLIIRPGALGDTILTLPLISSVRKLAPDADVTFLGNRAYKSLLPPGVTFQAFDDPRWLWLFEKGGSPQKPQDARYRTAFVILTRGQEVLENLWRHGAGNIRHVSPAPRPGKHMVEHIHEGLGLPVPPREPSLLHLARAAKQDLIWIHPGSGGARKCLPLDEWIAIAHHLQGLTGWEVAITASEEDAFLKQDPSWVSLTEAHGRQLLDGKLLREVCAELAAARLFVGSDSGISHLAAGLGVHSAVLFSATDPVTWAPWAPVGQVSVVDVRKGEWGCERLLSELGAVLDAAAEG